MWGQMTVTVSSEQRSSRILESENGGGGEGWVLEDKVSSDCK